MEATWDTSSLINPQFLNDALIKNLHAKLGLHKVAFNVANKEIVKQLICFSSIKINSLQGVGTSAGF